MQVCNFSSDLSVLGSLEMWILIFKLSQHWVYSSPSHLLEHFSYSRGTAQLHMAEQALGFSCTVVLADGSFTEGSASFCASLLPSINQTPSVQTPAQRRGWCLISNQLWNFLFVWTVEIPIHAIYFNAWFLRTPRNQEVYKLVLFIHFQTPAEELEKRGWWNSLSWYRNLPLVSISVILPRQCRLRSTDHSGTKSS